MFELIGPPYKTVEAFMLVPKHDVELLLKIYKLYTTNKEKECKAICSNLATPRQPLLRPPRSIT